MIWILLIAAATFASQVSCQRYAYTGTILLTKEEFCKQNSIYKWRCENEFKNFLDANPHIQLCSTSRPIYSDRCSALPIAQPIEQPACAGNDCNTFGIRLSATGNQPQRPTAGGDDNFEVPMPSVPYDTKVMDFSVKLFQKAFPSDDSSNYIISPLMVQSLLSYLYDGASGATRQEMESVLQLNMNDLHDIDRALKPGSGQEPLTKNKLDSASQIFKSTTIELLPAFRESLKRNQVPLEEMDFSNPRLAAETINNWAKQKTRERILDVIDEQSIDPTTKLLLMNALYFNGTWMYKFNKTERGSFYVNGQPAQRSAVKMMFLTKELRNGNTRTDVSSNGMYWIELPYDGDRMSMILMLPNERFQLDRELRRFRASHLQTILSEIELDETNKVRVQLPEFKAESTVSLVEPLKQLGIASMFGDRKPFDQLSNDEVKISDVKQKSFLTVNPHGTVATSVTTATVIPLSITQTLDFKADQPFALIIMDKQNKLPLFFAKISQPLKVKAAKNQ
ncbi:serpin B6-like isoform X2 [Anopheles stephensi]|uniref:serpin B6-like isoform X2 n=1 Tax=Anopheles stephensi TaxID=30069 RepID=UPI0016587685|nr:serpin B6-like isoform X2 [Anopheles stephensi]